MWEKELAYTSIVIGRMTIDSKMLNKMVKNNILFGDKYGTSYSEEVSTLKYSNQEPKLKSATTYPRGKFVA